MTIEKIEEIIKKFERYKATILSDKVDYNGKEYSEIRAETEATVKNYFSDDQELWNYLAKAWLNPQTTEHFIQSRNAMIMVLTSLIEKLKHRRNEEETVANNNRQLQEDIARRVTTFEDEAVKHGRYALYWLGGFGGIFLFFLFMLICKHEFFENFIDVTSKVITKAGSEKQIDLKMLIGFEYGRYIFFRLLTTSLFVYGIIVCIKNYNAHMHNSIVNRHRANSVNIAKSMVENAAPDTKNHIYMAVSNAIFEHQASGYEGKNAEPANPNILTKAVEVIREKI